MKNYIELEIRNNHGIACISIRAKLADGGHLSMDIEVDPEDFEENGDFLTERYLVEGKAVEKLLQAIDGKDDPEEALFKEFGDYNSFLGFGDFCKEHAIPYRFS